jgi:endonuclease/exonuclease/phosphatase family metal-dependent hydrolase
MKLVTLNIWGGHVRDPLLAFARAHQEIDIFCLQEVYYKAPDKLSTDERFVSLDIFSELLALLPDHYGYFRPTVKNVYGIAMLVRKSINVISEGEMIIHDNPDYPGFGPEHPRNLQWLECQIHGRIYSILNVHCLWNGRGKTDTPERVAQSQRIREFMDTVNTPKILCGDFNLRPDTESLKILDKGMRNLVEEYGVTSTRTSYYPKPEKFADYIFTSPEITVKNFAVMPEEVSDHAALMLEFD